MFLAVRRRFQQLIMECLSACKDKPVEYDQRHTELLVKMADMSKAFQKTGCSGFPGNNLNEIRLINITIANHRQGEDNSRILGCTAEGYTCTDNLAIFEPSFAPHTTVNKLDCE